MPAWLARFLPQISIAVAIIAAMWALDHHGYARAMRDRDARDARMLGQLRADLRQSETRLANMIAAVGADYARHSAAIATTRALLQPTITREISHETRLANPALGLSPGLLDAVNAARAAGPCTATADGDIECAMPTVAAGH